MRRFYPKGAQARQLDFGGVGALAFLLDALLSLLDALLGLLGALLIRRHQRPSG